MKRAMLLVFVAAMCASGCANKATLSYVDSRYGLVDQYGKIYQDFEVCVKKYIETHTGHVWVHSKAMIEGQSEAPI